MISLSFVTTLPIFIAAIAIFFCGVARSNEQASKRMMSAGLVVGLVGVIVAAIQFCVFSL
ncbi:hypothetical protein ACFLVG_01340 [Chloroflexota bacterium]